MCTTALSSSNSHTHLEGTRSGVKSPAKGNPQKLPLNSELKFLPFAAAGRYS